MSDIFIATDSFVTRIGGETYRVVKDATRVREGHALLDASPQNFKPLDIHYDVERATKAPGEKKPVKAKKDS